MSDPSAIPDSAPFIFSHHVQPDMLVPAVLASAAEAVRRSASYSTPTMTVPSVFNSQLHSGPLARNSPPRRPPIQKTASAKQAYMGIKSPGQLQSHRRRALAGLTALLW
eukprot:IDg12007t1